METIAQEAKRLNPYKSKKRRAKFNSWKFSEWWEIGGKIPRKVKKAILGRKISGSHLKRKLKLVIVGEPIKTMYEIREFGLDPFCPHCAETKTVGTGNMSEYPEHWERFHCLRCRKVVGYIDNSPFIHALECAEYGYDPVF